jgi:hypothetical protein
VSSKPSSKPVKAERKSGSDAVAASETGGGEAAPADGGESKGARATRRSGASGGESGLARRSERNPGSSDSDFKPPEPLSDAAITAMTPEEVKTTLSKVSEARQRMPKDDPEQVRLKREFDKLMGRLRGGGS